MNAWLTTLLGCASLVVIGCGPGQVYQCEASDQCVIGGVMGSCQDNGFCGFPDDSCPSGTRYGEQAPPGLSRVCIEPEASATDASTTGCIGPDCTTSSTTTLTTGEPDSTTAASTTDTGTSEPTVGLSATDASSDSSGGSSSSGSDSGSSGSDSSSGGAECLPVADDFADAAIDEDLWLVTGPTQVIETDGRLQLLSTDLTSDATGVTSDALDVSNAEITVHLVEPPSHLDIPFVLRLVDPLSGATAELTLGSDNQLTMLVEGTQVDVSLQPASERWLRVNTSLGSLFVSTSTDGTSFDDAPLGRLGLSYAASTAEVSLMRPAYALDEEDERPPIEIESFFYCGTSD